MQEEKHQKMKHYAKLMIAFSLAIMLYGVFLDLKSDVRLINPITDVKVESVGIDKTQSTIDINATLVGDENYPKEPAPIEENPKESIQDFSELSIPTLQSTNNNIRNEIQNQYGITVKYGNETAQYEVGGLTTTPITNETTAYTVLNRLSDALDLYPDGFFQEIKNGGIPLTIYLVDRYSTNGVTGVTDSNAYFADISIAVAYPFEESFFHESYHYIERYMLDRKGFNFNNWNNYNPSNFTYGNTDYTLSYVSNNYSEDSFFVNNYAQTSEAEDRASTFEYMMDTKKASCLNREKPIWKKAKTISQSIEASFDTCSPNIIEHWERFL